jgi:hypothetical protein
LPSACLYRTATWFPGRCPAVRVSGTCTWFYDYSFTKEQPLGALRCRCCPRSPLALSGTYSGLSLRCSDPSENEPSGVTFSFHPIPGRGDDPPSREGPALSGYDYGYSGSRPAFTPARAHPRQMPVLPVARARQRRLKADRSNSPGRSLGLAAVRSFARSLARRDSRGRAGWVYGVCCRRLDVIGPGPKCHIESDTTP